nr:ATP-binding protein [Ramlibacter albus]
MRLARGFPVVALTGPRQSGKTTLARSAFPGKPYVSLENPVEREFALRDMRGFLARFPQGAILDEVQRHPEIFSWLQGVVDENRRMGEFVLTGSHQFDLMAGITQTLAGRVGRIELLPLAASELGPAGLLASSVEEAMWRGAFPALYDRDIGPADWFANYVATYVERDVRQLVAVRDLAQFQKFVRMCAARSGQLLNLASLGADCGITAVTARHWLSVLEASYLVVLLRPYHRNFGKRLVKTPKLYFTDSGLAAWLLGVDSPGALVTHPARGALFETWVVAELLKHTWNQGRPTDIFFWRDNVGHEVDVLFDTPAGLQAIEIKSGTTFAADWPAAARKWASFAGEEVLPPAIVYGGEGRFDREGCRVLGWRELAGQ